jgi:hypothetical protein
MPNQSVFVGEVEGVDCCKPLSRQEVAAIEAAMDEYAVLVRARELPGCCGAIDLSRWIDFVEMAECADLVFRLPWIALQLRPPNIGDRDPQRLHKA